MWVEHIFLGEMAKLICFLKQFDILVTIGCFFNVDFGGQTRSIEVRSILEQSLPYLSTFLYIFWFEKRLEGLIADIV